MREATQETSGTDRGRAPGADRRVVITGIGVVSGVGIGARDLWAGLQRCASPVRTITRFDPSPFRSRIAVEVGGFDPTLYMDAKRARRLDRFGQFSLAAARQALDDAGLEPSALAGERTGVQIGSALGGIAHAESQVYRFREEGLRAVDPRLAVAVFGGASSCNIAIEYGLTGPNSTNSMSCASGTIAVGDAWHLIRRGTVDAVLAGGVEAPLAPLTYGAFANIRAMSTRNDDPETSCRPFDRGRDGFVMGEGAAILLLEERESARERGARAYAEISGYGHTNDAYHMTAPRPDGSQASRAMREALTTAELSPDRIDYVNAHGSSTPLNDSTESQAVRSVLGERADEVPVSGTKPYHGHALGASGAMEVAICALALQHGWIPPTLNLVEPDPECELVHVPPPGRSAPLRHIMTNSFGFGGVNASLVLSA